MTRKNLSKGGGVNEKNRVVGGEFYLNDGCRRAAALSIDSPMDFEVFVFSFAFAH